MTRSSIPLWILFVLVHLLLGYLALEGAGYPLGDVQWVYPVWVDRGLGAGEWVGLTQPWVYPVLALVPMLIANVLGGTVYAGTWLTMVMVLNALAFGLLLGRTGAEDWRRRRAAAVVWLIFLVLLGPIALGRIDSVTVPLALAGMVLLASHPRVAAVLITLAAWIKVWPAALVVAAIVTDARRRVILVAAVVTSAVIALVAVILGGGGQLLSFVGQQSGRALQVEAPISTFWMIDAATHRPGAPTVYYSTTILTFQVRGPGVAEASALMTPLLVLVVAIVLVIGALAIRRGALPTAVLPWLALSLVMAMISLQKVGSPQFISWIAVPIVFGVLVFGTASRGGFGGPTLVACVIAALTQLLYPYLYSYLLALQPAMIAVLALRNALDVALLIWAVSRLVRLARPARIPAPETSTVAATRIAPATSAAPETSAALD